MNNALITDEQRIVLLSESSLRSDDSQYQWGCWS